MNDRILRAPKCAQKLGMSERQFHREIARGNIPAGFKVSERVTGWRESTIDQVIADRETGKKVTQAAE